MRILLFGEFSGFFNCLRDGLVENGHDVFMVSNGDGKRGYDADYNWYVSRKKYGRFAPVFEVAKVLKHRDLISGYDAVLLIHPHVFSNIIPLVKPVYDYIFKHNDKVFLSGAGLTQISRRFWYQTEGKYHNYVEGVFKDLPRFRKLYNSKSLTEWEDSLMKRINGYIPIWYEYAEPFRQYKTCLKTIRIPVNVEKFTYTPNVVKEKIVFMASVSPRSNSKGLPYIKAAMDKMREKYGNVAEFITAGGLPFNEYMDLVSRANVIMDDANSFSIAMNGLFSLAQGKIVMGGAEPIANKELGLDWNPVINICPDVDQICSCIEDIIIKKDQIEEIGHRGRLFVEQYHDYRDIAQQYIDVFKNN